MSIANLKRHMLTHLGPFTRRELLSHASSTAVNRAIARGEIVRILPNRYAAAVHADSWLVRTLAVSDWTRGTVGGDAALRLAGLAEEPRIVDVTVPPGEHRRGPHWVRIHSTSARVDTWTAHGRPVSLPALAVVQAFSWADARERSERVFGPCRRGANKKLILEAAAGLSRIPDRRLLVRCLAAAQQGAESYLEMHAARVLAGPLLGACVRQHRVRVEGEAFRLDAFHVRSATAFEFDGEEFHSRPAEVREDRRRDALLASIGIQTVRFAYRDVMGDLGRCRAVAESTVRRRM